jgi:hypothetical protein
VHQPLGGAAAQDDGFFLHCSQTYTRNSSLDSGQDSGGEEEGEAEVRTPTELGAKVREGGRGGQVGRCLPAGWLESPQAAPAAARPGLATVLGPRLRCAGRSRRLAGALCGSTRSPAGPLTPPHPPAAGRHPGRHPGRGRRAPQRRPVHQRRHRGDVGRRHAAAHASLGRAAPRGDHP